MEETEIVQMLSYVNSKIYKVNITGVDVCTIVTKDAAFVDEWIRDIYTIRDGIKIDSLIVGVDARTPNNTHHHHYCTLQLCFVSECLVYQISSSSDIPQSLKTLFENQDNVFVGVNIEHKLRKLSTEYNIGSKASYVDLGHLASVRNNSTVMHNFELRELADYVLQKDISLPEGAMVSDNWGAAELEPRQVLDATTTAFVSSEIGWDLIAAPLLSVWRQTGDWSWIRILLI